MLAGWPAVSHFTLFRRHLEEHNGRLVDTAGDSLLAVFESVTDAVLCAMAAQKSKAQRLA